MLPCHVLRPAAPKGVEGHFWSQSGAAALLLGNGGQPRRSLSFAIEPTPFQRCATTIFDVVTAWPTCRCV